MTLDLQFWLQILIYALSFGAMWGNFSTRLHYLEQKMDKHNDVQNRMAVAENNIKTLYHNWDTLHEKE